MSRIPSPIRALVLALVLVVLAPTLPASASTGPVLIAGLAGPLGLAVGPDGTVYVTEAFAGRLTAIDTQGHQTVLVFSPGQEIAGVDAKGGTVVFTQSLFDGPPGPEAMAADTLLGRVVSPGKTSRIASLQAFETANNPDAKNTYGLQNASKACVDQAEAGGDPATHPGIVESHPYAVTSVPGGYAIADAAANAIFGVSGGAVRTIAVLPPVRQTIDQNAIDQLAEEDTDASACLGATYLGEPVPTDVEVGPDGYYYVTSLPGFPEVGGAGALWRVNPATGAVQMITTGLYGPVDLAITADGTIYVAELFGNRITAIKNGRVLRSYFADSPGAIEVGPDGTIYVTTGVFGNGAVRVFNP